MLAVLWRRIVVMSMLRRSERLGRLVGWWQSDLGKVTFTSSLGTIGHWTDWGAATLSLFEAGNFRNSTEAVKALHYACLIAS